MSLRIYIENSEKILRLSTCTQNKSANVFSVHIQTHLAYMYRPSQFQVCRIWSFCGGIQNTSARVLLFYVSTQINYSEFLRTYAEKLRVTIIILRIYVTIQCFGISADVRIKTAQDYYHFSAATQVTIVWSFCRRLQKNSACLLPLCASTHNSVFWSFCGYTQISLIHVQIIPMMC